MGVPSQGLYFAQEKVFLEYQINRVGEGVLIKGWRGEEGVVCKTIQKLTSVVGSFI